MARYSIISAEVGNTDNAHILIGADKQFKMGKNKKLRSIWGEMKTQSSKIRYMQFMYIIAAFVYGSHMLLTPLKQMVKQDMNSVLIMAFLMSLPLILTYALLTNWFPGKDLMQILKIVYGAYIGRAICALYVLFFFLLLSFNIYDLGVFYTSLIMPDTPLIILLITITLLCAYTLKRGIDTVASLSVWIVWLGIIIAVVTMILLTYKMDINNFLPVFQQPFGTYAQAASIFTVVPLGEIVVLLMLTADLHEIKDSKKFLFGVPESRC